MSNVSTGTRIRQWLMTGVSHMIPFVAAGGILIALGFLFGAVAAGTDGIHAYDAAKMSVPVDGDGKITGFNLLNIGNWAFIIFWLGKAAFAFFVPVLAGYIAYAIADRPGLAPGFVAGALATGLDGNPLGTGTGGHAIYGGDGGHAQVLQLAGGGVEILVDSHPRVRPPQWTRGNSQIGARQIRPCAKGTPCPGNDQRADGGVGLNLVQRRPQLPVHLLGQAV